ncbi:similar to Saccharomyces cerevisiae YNL168C FMP41 Putative protein of unknown function [Maudiozyma barnettii]|uniref:Fumarylacetoacetase-like C-terminal domain-containing protein n=1 Tax=Maudiozyma barnettii TaxID=61262 RepID=A0A8H2ZFV9_9SACH|nr:Fmp41p [Kazachstania barnettii]CAB4253899.1 similar to Saccharomyces cerevisiae YNL168C FMP41 Putative protein of unknown function [Kazachstania barnettii]CAD1781649.1 similar to Saccharomyces cerevisiae YNL168C FMP41 Putative protein of unknown function [Kazachstania barnettii]
MSFKYLKSVNKIVCIGRNYAAHIKELNNAIPKHPFFFEKPTTTLITPLSSAEQSASQDLATFTKLREDGTNPSPIYIPKNVNVHHEVELGLVMKNTISNISADKFGPQDLLDNVAGFCLAFDLTGRNVQADAKKKGLPWFFAKGYDTFSPVSQMLTPDEIPGFKETPLDQIHSKFQLKCYVNLELRQEGHLDLMLNPMHKIVGHIAEAVTLQAGDLVLTGTPAGVGQLKSGDVIRGQLFFGDNLLVDMSFDCQNRPGSYEYKSS